ncbi:hypothetical protein MNBD_GAMMA01-2176 [hydrothermal vent metagenome]|uniref:PpiC domain-containing protein n=1 Tax=hydrothermal vent metagenome TaxID=652676 RepID=A0A3B0UUV9_9ZZZZ
MKIIILLSALLSVVTNTSFALDDNILVKQGVVTIEFTDIDGFSHSMPVNVKSGFFNSLDRIDSTLKTILTMKHIVNYAKNNSILDEQLINSNISNYLVENSEAISQINLNDMQFLQLKQYLLLKMSYQYVQNHIRDSVEYDDLLELAQEQYLVTKPSYFQKHMRDIRYIKVRYTEANKQQQLQLARNIQQQLLANELDFDKVAVNYGSSKDVEFIQDINDFYYNDKYKEFSDFVFKPDNTGLIDNILDAENIFMVAIITKISPEGYKDFTEVKDSILAKLKNDKVTRKFANLVSTLTQDPVEINEESIISLKTRYLEKVSQR